METEITEIKRNLNIVKMFSPGSHQFNQANKILNKYHRKYGTVDTSIIESLLR